MKYLISLVVLLAGCVSLPKIVTLPNGMNIVEVAAECPLPGKQGRSCYVPVSGVSFLKDWNDEYDRLHEREHGLGMHHSEFIQRGFEQCAVIITNGQTNWKPGTFICRSGNGPYLERDTL